MSAKVTPSLTFSGSGRPDLSLSVTLPVVDVSARAAEVGAEPLRQAARDAASERREVVKSRALFDQIRAAERRVAEAERTFEKVRAAKLLLESEPEEDFAAKLRAVTAELGAAERAKAEAVRDLETIRAAGVAPALWAPAANAIALAVSNVLDARQYELWREFEAAQLVVDEVLADLRAIVEKAVNERLLAPLGELQSLSAARDAFAADAGRILAAVRERLIGPPPVGCVPADRRYCYWRAEGPPAGASEPPAEPVVQQAAVRMMRMGGWSAPPAE